LLARWYEQVWVRSSPLSITPLIDRAVVDDIYQTLSTYFPKNYFRVNPNADAELRKIPWLFGVLSSHIQMECIHALQEVSTLLHYLQMLDQKIIKEFYQLQKNPQNLRSFFFELFIYRFLYQLQLRTKKNQYTTVSPSMGCAKSMASIS
jgi:hypothetical protein